MRKIFHLANCTTCQRILKELEVGDDFEYQNIKEENISAKELKTLAKQTGSYESLFSRRAMKYRSTGLHEKNLSEEDYKQLILDEYTFLKRPVIIVDGEVFVGNTKKIVEAAKTKLKNI